MDEYHQISRTMLTQHTHYGLQTDFGSMNFSIMDLLLLFLLLLECEFRLVEIEFSQLLWPDL